MAIGSMCKKIGEYRMCSSEDMIADKHTQTDRQTDRHAHHNTPLLYRGRVKNQNGATKRQQTQNAQPSSVHRYFITFKKL